MDIIGGMIQMAVVAALLVIGLLLLLGVWELFSLERQRRRIKLELCDEFNREPTAREIASRIRQKWRMCERRANR
jgi:hypothetical protein